MFGWSETHLCVFCRILACWWSVFSSIASDSWCWKQRYEPIERFHRFFWRHFALSCSASTFKAAELQLQKAKRRLLSDFWEKKNLLCEGENVTSVVVKAKDFLWSFLVNESTRDVRILKALERQRNWYRKTCGKHLQIWHWRGKKRMKLWEQYCLRVQKSSDYLYRHLTTSKQQENICSCCSNWLSQGWG